jgi:hypothetical protein
VSVFGIVSFGATEGPRIRAFEASVRRDEAQAIQEGVDALAALRNQCVRARSLKGDDYLVESLLWERVGPYVELSVLTWP